MKYYILKPAVDTPETGHVFPAADSYDDYDFNAPNSVHKLLNHQLPNFTPDLRFKLKHGAKPVDLLSEAAFKSAGLLASEEFVGFVRGFNLIPYKILSVDIEFKKKYLKYYRIHFVWDDWSLFVDWNKTNFQEFKDGKFIPIEINSYTEYITEVNKSKFFRIRPVNPVISDTPYDLFNHPFIGKNQISLKLKAALENSNLKGISITQ